MHALRVCTLLSVFALIPVSAGALIVATNADDICSPTTDPCIISETVDVEGPLNFGLRTVHITGSGKLEGTSINITASEVLCDVESSTTVVDMEEAESGGSLSITAVRACSGDSLTPCLLDSTCSSFGLGTCSVGAGTIDFDCKISGRGFPGGSVDMDAVGDIRTGRLINVNGTNTESEGGSVRIESNMESVLIEGQIHAEGGTNVYYYGMDSYGGEIVLTAANDVVVLGALNGSGRDGGGETTLTAGRDIIVEASINDSAGTGDSATGGTVTFNAGRNLVLTKPSEVQEIKVSVDGGGFCYFYGYGNSCGFLSGYGGYVNIYAGADVAVGENVVLQSRGGPGDTRGGSIYVDAGGHVSSAGSITARDSNTPSEGAGGFVQVRAQDGLTMEKTATLATNSSIFGGEIEVLVDGTVILDGKIDVRGMETGPYGGYAGDLRIVGNADVTLGGTILTGGAAGRGSFVIDVCRLRMPKSGRINAIQGAPEIRNTDINIAVGESIVLEPKAKILADQAGASVNIFYRDPNKPPVLSGATVQPVPNLSVNPGLAGCPVCGNLEIDQDESCDDGNTTDGDGCRSDCQDEGCVAQTPGFPATSLCDDTDACTVDTCDPIAHQCANTLSCEEGVACTVDSCVSAACEHVPDDALCNDFNECTDDLCNSTTGCVYADLTGIPCQDGDLCTVTGDCSQGDCVATDIRLADRVKISARMKDGPGNDRLTIKSEVPLSLFASAPTATGMTAYLADANEQPVFFGDIPAAAFEDKRGDGAKFSFKDSKGLIPEANGIVAVKVRKITTKGIAKVVVKMRNTEIPGAADQLQMTVSLLFGSDPAVDECVSRRRIPCTVKPGKTSCKE